MRTMRIAYQVGIMLLALGLAACGNANKQTQSAATGGGGTAPQGSSFAVGGKGQRLTLTLRNAQGVVSSTFAPGDTITVEAQLVDAYGRPVSGEFVDFTTSSVLDTIAPGFAFTDANGVAIAALTIGPHAGTFSVSASVLASVSAVATYTVNAGTLTLKLQDQNGKAVNSLPVGQTFTVVAHVVDGHGNPAKSVPVQFTLPANAKATLSVPFVLTDAYGDARLTLSSAAPDAGLLSASADLQGVTLTAQVPYQFTTAIAQANLVLSLATNTVSVGGSTLATATVTDANGKPLTNQIVRFRVAGLTPGVATVSPPSALTDANGQAQATIVGVKAGADALVAELLSSAGVVAASAQQNFQVQQAAVQKQVLKLVVDRYSLPADGVTASTATVTVTDQAGKPVSGASLSVGVNAGAHAVLSATKVTTNAQGSASVRLTDVYAEAVVLTLKDAYGSTASQTVVFTPAVATLTATAKPVDVLADGTSAATVTVIAKDRNGAPVANEVLALSTTSATAVLPGQVTTDVLGRATFQVTDTVAETVRVTIKTRNGGLLPGVVKSASVQIRFQLTKLQVTVHRQGVLVADGTPQALTVTVLDAAGNPVAGQSLSVSTSKPTIIPSATQIVTDAYGKAPLQVRDYVAETGTLTLTDPTNTLKFTFSLTFVSADAYSVSVLASSTQLPADGTSAAVLVATVRDVYGAAVPNAYVRWETTDPYVVLSATDTLTDVYGQASISVRSPQATTATIVARLPANPKASPTRGSASMTVTFTPVGATAQPRVVLSLATNTVSVGGSTLATATVTDANGKPLANQIVRFRVAGVTPGVASVSPTSALTDATGKAQATLAGLQAGADALVAEAVSANGVPLASAQVAFQVTPVQQQPASIQLVANRYVIRTDNTTVATLTAVVTDAYGGPVRGINIVFSATGGQLGARTATTDAYGQATTTLSSGLVDKRNQTVTVTASAGAGLSASVPIQITGTTVVLTNQTASLQTGGGVQDVVYATVKDAAGLPLFNVPVHFAAGGSVQITTAGGYGAGSVAAGGAGADAYTDANGQAWAVVQGGAAAGTGTLQVSALNAQASLSYTVTNPANLFAVKLPAVDPYDATVGGYVHFQAQTGGSRTITVASSFGDIYTLPQAGKNVTNPYAFAIATGQNLLDFYVWAGKAGAGQVTVTSDVYGTITRTVRFAQPPASATTVTLNASTRVLAPSAPPNLSTATLTARVTRLVNGQQQPVGGATVRFYLPAPAGTGEYVTPATVVTDATGVATATFVAGTQPTGSAGVDIYAVVVDAAGATKPQAKTNIVVGGQAASIAIGRGTVVLTPDPATYVLPMSVVVTDANGNPVPGANVTIQTWPSFYRFGTWAVSPNGSCVHLVYRAYSPKVDNGKGTPVLPTALPAGTAFRDWYSTVKGKVEWIPNEDWNQNLVLDPYEDVQWTVDVYGMASPQVLPLNSKLDAPSSAGGAAPGTVVTDAQGLATFNLVYPKAYAVWVTTRITAKVNVQGSEAATVTEFMLPALATEASKCLLPPSPFNDPTWP